MHLFVADDLDLPDLRNALQELPADAYGQAFIETEQSKHDDLERPAGISVTWLLRDPADRSRPVGSHAAVASGAWAAEWMVAAARPPQRTLVWVGVLVRASVHVLMAHSDCSCQHEHEHGHVGHTQHEHRHHEHGRGPGEGHHGPDGTW